MIDTEKNNGVSEERASLVFKISFFFLSFFLWFGRPKPITGLSGPQQQEQFFYKYMLKQSGGSTFYCTRIRFKKRTCSAKVRKTNLQCQVFLKTDNRMISANNLRRKFLIFLSESGRARFAEENKEFS